MIPSFLEKLEIYQDSRGFLFSVLIVNIIKKFKRLCIERISPCSLSFRPLSPSHQTHRMFVILISTFSAFLLPWFKIFSSTKLFIILIYFFQSAWLLTFRDLDTKITRDELKWEIMSAWTRKVTVKVVRNGHILGILWM